MAPTPEKTPEDVAAAPAGDDAPGVPGFRTWRGVYGFIVACFVFYVVFLAVLPRLFS